MPTLELITRYQYLKAAGSPISQHSANRCRIVSCAIRAMHRIKAPKKECLIRVLYEGPNLLENIRLVIVMKFYTLVR